MYGRNQETFGTKKVPVHIYSRNYAIRTMGFC